ncbi:MAG TPA: hypothetical protein VIL20_30510 [Sandaracinaceae bacterium]
MPSDWALRSEHIERHGSVDFFHFDYRAQALWKLARAHERDLDDVRAMMERRLVSRAELRAALAEIEPLLVRYPGLDADAFRRRARSFLEEAS